MSASQLETVLAKGGFRDAADVLLATPSDIARACKVPLQQANKIVSLVCREHAQPLRSLRACLSDPDESFTTGDSELDAILGGGITTGMVWEVVGESAAGKTQLALQLALCVQLPRDLGGASGAACYITVASHLQTSRLEQILDAHPRLSPAHCTFADVQTVQTPTVPRLVHVLSTFLPQYIDDAASRRDPPAKPLKLLVVDALAELFHSAGKTTTRTLVERARQISEIAFHLHLLASKYRIAVLVLNEVIDVVDRDDPPGDDVMSYRVQSRLFGRPDSIPEEARKEAALGLVWANQVNTRIFLTRTRRRRYLDESEAPQKRLAVDKLATPQVAVTPSDQPVLIRRLSIVFSSVVSPASCDYIVTAEGISVVPGSTVLVTASHPGTRSWPETTPAAEKGKEKAQAPPLDASYVADSFAAETGPPTPENELGPTDDTDEWDTFWAQNALPDEVFTQLDTSTALPSSNA